MKRIASEVKVPEEYIRASSKLNSVLVWAHIHLCICKYLQVWVYTCVCVHVHVHAYACLHTHKSISASVPLCICMCACTCIHVCVHVCYSTFPLAVTFPKRRGENTFVSFKALCTLLFVMEICTLAHGPLSSWHLHVDFSEMKKRWVTVSPSHYPCIYRLANILV